MIYRTAYILDVTPLREMGIRMLFDSKSLSVAAGVAAALAVPVVAGAGPARMPEFAAEKCYDIAVASQNDCKTSTHSCAGETKRARDKESLDLRPGDLRENRRRQL
jgi:uncharacterized membrane protein